MTEPRTDAEIAAELERMFGEPVEGRDFQLMPDATITPRSLAEFQAVEAAEQPTELDPAAALFYELLGKARPDMSHVEALANGARYKAALIRDAGMTPEQVAALYRGYSLIVHLDRTGEVRGVHKLLPHDEAEVFVTQNARTTIVAAWGLT